MADGSPNLLGRNERNQVQGADVGTQGAQHALVDIQFDVGKASETAGRFASGLLLVEAEFDFCQSNPSIRGDDRYIEPVPSIVRVVEAVELLQFDQLTFLIVRCLAGEVFVDGRRDFAPIGDCQDEGAGPVGGITSCPYSIK